MTVLDPRIAYEGLKCDFANDPILLADLESSRQLLREYYDENYAAKAAPSEAAPKTGSGGLGSSRKVDFTARYQQTMAEVIDELGEYFQVKRKDFKTCDPLKWWWSQRENWPNLYQLVCDILCIPGKYCCHLEHLVDNHARFCCGS
jgi:hypothetical protein